MTDQDTTTVKHNVSQINENELEAARTAYLQAYETFTKAPTVINHKARCAAYDHLEHIRSLYNAGRKALIQKRVIDRQ